MAKKTQNDLLTFSKYLINQQFNKYHSGSLATIFTKEHLTSISHDLIMEIQNKEGIDEQGIYSYFKKSFSNKCKDLLYQGKSFKRNLENIDYLNEEEPVQCPNNPCVERKLDSHQSVINCFKYLDQTFNINKDIYKKILTHLFSGHTSKEIISELKLTPSTYERRKNELFSILKKLNYSYEEDSSINSAIYSLPEVKPVKLIYTLGTNIKYQGDLAKIELIAQVIVIKYRGAKKTCIYKKNHTLKSTSIDNNEQKISSEKKYLKSLENTPFTKRRIDKINCTVLTKLFEENSLSENQCVQIFNDEKRTNSIRFTPKIDSHSR